MIQTVPFISHQKKQNGYNNIRPTYKSIWLYMLRVIVLEDLFFYSIYFNLGQIWYWGNYINVKIIWWKKTV